MSTTTETKDKPMSSSSSSSSSSSLSNKRKPTEDADGGSEKKNRPILLLVPHKPEFRLLDSFPGRELEATVFHMLHHDELFTWMQTSKKWYKWIRPYRQCLVRHTCTERQPRSMRLLIRVCGYQEQMARFVKEGINYNQSDLLFTPTFSVLLKYVRGLHYTTKDALRITPLFHRLKKCRAMIMTLNGIRGIANEEEEIKFAATSTMSRFILPGGGGHCTDLPSTTAQRFAFRRVLTMICDCINGAEKRWRIEAKDGTRENERKQYRPETIAALDSLFAERPRVRDLARNRTGKDSSYKALLYLEVFFALVGVMEPITTWFCQKRWPMDTCDKVFDVRVRKMLTPKGREQLFGWTW